MELKGEYGSASWTVGMRILETEPLAGCVWPFRFEPFVLAILPPPIVSQPLSDPTCRSRRVGARMLGVYDGPNMWLKR